MEATGLRAHSPPERTTLPAADGFGSQTATAEGLSTSVMYATEGSTAAAVLTVALIVSAVAESVGHLSTGRHHSSDRLSGQHLSATDWRN